MSNTPYEAQANDIIKQAVSARIAKAKEIGAKASWSTENHLDMLNDLLGLAQSVEERRALLGRYYNVSQFQQELARDFAGTGHFVRESKGTKLKNSLFAEMAQAEAAKAAQS